MLTNLLFLKLLILFNLNITTPISESVCETYCNARFEYCVDYMDNYFDAYELSDNGDGVVLFNSDSKVRLILSGTYNVLDYSSSDLVEEYINNLRKETSQNVAFLEEGETDNGKIALFQTTGAYHFVQFVLSEDSYASAVLIVPQQNDTQLYNIKDQIKLYSKNNDIDQI